MCAKSVKGNPLRRSAQFRDVPLMFSWANTEVKHAGYLTLKACKQQVYVNHFFHQLTYNTNHMVNCGIQTLSPILLLQCLWAEAVRRNEALQPSDAPLQHPCVPPPPWLPRGGPDTQTGQDLRPHTSLAAPLRQRLLHGPQVLPPAAFYICITFTCGGSARITLKQQIHIQVLLTV